MLGLAGAHRRPGERRAALAEGEALLAAGAISHNHLWFYQVAIEAALEGRRLGRGRALRRGARGLHPGRAAALVGFLRRRGRALAACGRGARDAATLAELQRLRALAERAGLRNALAALEAALGPEGRATLASA